MTDQVQYKKMTETPIPRLIVSLAAPSTLSMLMTSIYNMTDTYFVSNLNLGAAAAVGVVFALMSLIQSVGFTVGMGTSTYISQNLGKKQNDVANRYATGAILLAALLGGIVTVLGLSFLSPLLRLLGSTETALPYAEDYAFYILLAAPFMCVMFTLNNILRAEGHASLSMIGIVSGGLLNMALDPILIHGCGMGMTGAAVATMVSQFFSFAVLLSIFLLKKTIVRPALSSLPREVRLYGRILTNGFPTLCRQGLATLASALLAILAKPYGDAAIAAMTIATKIYTMVRSLIVGIGQGYQPMAGYNYGARRFVRVRGGFYFTTLLGTLICCAAAVALGIGAEGVISLFRTDADVVAIGAMTLRWFALVLPLLAYSTYVNQMLQCLGRSKTAAFLASCRQGVFFIPLIFLLSYTAGLPGIAATQALADLLTFLLSVPFQIAFFRSQRGLRAGI